MPAITIKLNVISKFDQLELRRQEKYIQNINNFLYGEICNKFKVLGILNIFEIGKL